MARGPIGHTCPDIDKTIGFLAQIRNEATYIQDHQPDCTESTYSAISTILDICNYVEASLEDLRSDNEQLRSWGADQEDDKNRAEDEAYRLHGQVSDLERRVAELEADVYRLEAEANT